MNRDKIVGLVVLVCILWAARDAESHEPTPRPLPPKAAVIPTKL